METTRLIPELREDGYLPDGVHLAEFEELALRFGTGSPRRGRLLERIRKWVALARVVGAKRIFVAGSFVTGKLEPADVDTVVLLPKDFAEQIDRGQFDALELAEMLTTRQPEEIFAAEDERDWYDWISFFTKSREPDGRTCGIIEVKL
jgi:hypothetical protein